MRFDAIKLKIASSEEILKWSHGEVLKPETINYRTQRPEKDGLFSERIFGPTKDWECYCGKYRKIRYKGIVCDKCGVEVTRSIVRRERMGHINLVAPVVHIWFLRTTPSKIALFLNTSFPKLERVIYYAAYIITSVNEENKKKALNEIEKEFEAKKKTARKEKIKIPILKEALNEARQQVKSLEVGKILSETEYYNLSRRFGNVFEAGSGAEAVKKILENINLKKLISELKKELRTSKDLLGENKILRRLKLVTAFLRNNMRPEWMVLTALPVIPPDLRPMVALDGGRYATSDLNDLYRRVINRNNRLKKLLELKAPEVILVNEKRMLQEAVDSLIDNMARAGSRQLSSQRRPLRSLADMLKGKQGRFRQNLLGKRVDYSGRSVIVVGPELKLHQCGLPKKMALELFKPFVINKIIEKGLSYNIKNANRLIEQASPEVWAILEEVIGDRKVLLNRAPTLHRLGVQAFQPILIEDLAIRIPPLVCSAFNADFDGDQMAVHLPLSEEAQKEATEIMFSRNNLLKPATGDPIATPSQDIVLGCYYLTKINDKAIGAGRLFADENEAMLAYENNLIDLNALIKIGSPTGGLETSLGRLIFNAVLPKGFELINKTMTKKELSKVVAEIIRRVGINETSEYLDAIKRLGFEYATLSGVSWGINDLIIPKEKEALLKKAKEEEMLIKKQFEEGLLTDEERRDRIIGVWDKTKDEVAKFVLLTLNPYGSVYSIIDSGARGSWLQPVQMTGMKGLVINPRGETIELPIKSSYKEGLSVLEYFISTHGARKGTTDTALKTASAGYLTRRLVDVAQDLVIKEEDCKVKEGIDIFRSDNVILGQLFANQLYSRTAIEDIRVKNKIVVRAGEIIDREKAELIEKSDLESVKIRSPITCKTLYGICSKCYGLDLGENRPVQTGIAVGIIAAQSIGEPGTQLTMRTFHVGGIAGADITHGLPRVQEVFEVTPPRGKAILIEDDGKIIDIEEKGLTRIVKIKFSQKSTPKGKAKRVKKEKVAEYIIPKISELYVKVGDRVKKGDQLCEGPIDLREFYSLKGKREVERYILNEIQKVYLSEGAHINNKHIEIIIRQMFSRVKIKDPGETEFLPGDIIEKSKFFEVNHQTRELGGVPARAIQLLMGIKKVALSTESFLSAASFQETVRVLVSSATEGRVDHLRGLKENVIIGQLIPVKTGLKAREEGILEEKETEIA
jgi:DNA-directed RNA polymerase subunit beta'